MKRKISIGCILFVFCFLSGIYLNAQEAQINKSIADIVGSYGESSEVITGNDTSHVNWTTQTIEAKGWSVIDTTRFKIAAQAKAMAITGAKVVAQRNLLEIIKGVHITSETIVEDMITQNDKIKTQIEGVIKGAQMKGDPVFNGDLVEVTLVIPNIQKGKPCRCCS